MIVEAAKLERGDYRADNPKTEAETTHVGTSSATCGFVEDSLLIFRFDSGAVILNG